MYFVHDTLADGRPYRILSVVDHRSRYTPVLETGLRVSRYLGSQILDCVLGEWARAHSITVNHGTKFPSRGLEDWAYPRDLQLNFI